MKDLVWDYILSVGIDEVDDDHKKLIDLFNMLSHSVVDGDSAEYQAAVLAELINCTAWHFSHEERLMIKHGYKGLAEHTLEHQELVKSAVELQQKIREDKPLSNKEIEFLEHWLTEHIFTTDMKMGAYLAEVM